MLDIKCMSCAFVHYPPYPKAEDVTKGHKTIKTVRINLLMLLLVEKPDFDVKNCSVNL